MLSPSGQCKTFDASADGFVPGEGAGALVLKRLSDAEADHDQIYGVIIASGINQDGATNGITAPSVNSQIELEREIYENYQIDPDSISYVEMHGTGTQLGDPIELEALATVFREKTQRKQDCAIGSVKSNIGHTLAAAGLASVQKVLLAMKHKKLVPSLHFKQPNPHFDIEASPFYVNTKVQDWQSEANIPRRAAVSSFGFSGTNAHLVIEEYLERRNEIGTRHRTGASPIGPYNSCLQMPSLFVLSAKSEKQLKSYAQDMKRWIEAHEELELADIAFTLQVGRQAMDYRLAIEASSREVLLQRLGEFANDHVPTGTHVYQVNKTESFVGIFEAEEDIQSLLHIWLQDKKISKIAQAWVKGVSVDWMLLYTGGVGSVQGTTIGASPMATTALPHRISLPTYPFARKPYWIPMRQDTVPTASTLDLLGLSVYTFPPRGQPESMSFSDPLEGTATTDGIVLRSLGDYREDGQRSTAVPVSLLPIGLKGADQPQSSSIKANSESDRGTGLAQGTGQEPTPSAPIAPALFALAMNMPEESRVQAEQGGGMGSPLEPVSIAPQLEEELVRSLAQALYAEQSDIDVDKPFIEMGLDSVTGVEWIQSLNTQYAINLKAGSIYDYPTIRQLAGFLQEELSKHQPTPVQSISILDLDDPQEPVGPQMGSVGVGLASDQELQQVQPSSPAQSLDQPSIGAYPTSEEPLQAREAVGELAPSSFPLGRQEAIAIVGISGQYPDANNLGEYWENLVQGKNAVREIPLSRFDVSRYYDPRTDQKGKIYCKWLGALDEIEYFDPLFFHLSPAEAQGMDPQQRLFLEEGYKAFENAGYSPRLLNNTKCGVYLGILGHEYSVLLSQQNALATDLLGTSFAIAAARIAYLLNLKGSALAIDTACSSSLVAAHLACQALRNQEIDMALVGGVSLYLTPDLYVSMCNAGMLSPDGQCKAFDASANGFVPGEGVGAVVLKRLADAEANHDQIYGVIIASGMNQDGATNGMTAPNIKSQMELVHEIYQRYQIDPASITYVEMHGTGTKIGDPMELEALANVFQEKTQRKQYCAIGSVKSNIGHTSAAAGVASLHKVLLAMQQKKLVPTLHFQRPNPHFDFEASPFYVNTEVQDWQSIEGTPLRAAVSSFGFSGTNAHLVVEEYLPRKDRALRRSVVSPHQSVVASLPRDRETPSLFVLSAKSEQQLKSYAQDMKHWIEAHEEQTLPNIAFTLQVGRVALDYRLAIEASSREILLQRLESFIDHQTSTGVYTAQVGKGTSDAILFETDDDGQSLLHLWCQKKKLAKLAQVWVRGVNVDWMLLYTGGTGSAQGTSQRGPALSVSTMPYRISLPTYPFARRHILLPSPKAEPMSSSTSLEKSTIDTKRVVLQPLADHPLPSGNGADQPQPPISQPLPDQSFSQVGSNGVIAPGLAVDLEPVVGTQMEINPIPPVPFSTLQISQLEEELASSLAEALYMERSDIDIDKPFIEIGLDSIIGVEWIRSINKQYASKLAAIAVYDYPTIRQLASFLQEEWLKRQQAPVQSIVSLDDTLQQVQQGHLEAEKIETRRDTANHREGSSLSACANPPLSPTYQRVLLEGPGGIDDLIIVETDMSELQAREVRVGVRAFSLNFGDLLCVKGLYPTMPPYPFTPGFEASGIVLDVGQDVTAFKIGDPVIALVGEALGGQATVMTCPEELVIPKPTALSFEEACALPAVATTMIAAFEKARLKPGEKILIQTATGGTGLIAIQLANYYQAEIYATAGSQPKLDYLKQLGVPYRINYQETDFEKEIERLTKGQGVDIVINTLSGDAIQKGINCLSSGGRYIEVAMTALKSARTVDLSVLSQNQTFYSIDLRKLARVDLATFKRYCSEMLHFVGEGIMSPTICQVFDWERLKDAYRYMEDRQHIGKIVVRIPETIQVNDRGIGMRKEAIAIVGMSGKYPNAKNLSEYWDNLVQAKNAIREIPRSRFDASDYYDPNPGQEGKISCKWLGALDEIEYFDPLFFHISPTEAEGMDPQHRLFLEEGYKAFEDAGYSPELLSNKKCGVYLGISGHEYGLLLHQQKPAETNLLGTSSAIAAARIAYLLNLKGPAIPIDTACSSSLVATHLACQALRHQEIDMALIGGVSLILTPGPYAGMSSIGMLSPDGQCKTFDTSANGFVPGEGVGAVVLKRLADAEADHDQIYGVIIGSGVNQDGTTNGITAPSMKSQIELEREIYGRYQIDPASISYVEMHGTATQLGDPIELEALATVFREKTQSKQYCAIGSVKSNIGHTLTAAGVAGLHKVLLAMQQKKLVPTLHFQQPNEHFDFAASPFYVNTEVQDWQSAPGIPRRAAVSSFGFSGTNAHVVIEEYIPGRRADGAHRDTPRLGSTKIPYLFVLSAKSGDQLKSYAQEMMGWIQTNRETALADIAFTLQLGRQAMDYRLAIESDSHEVLLQRLEEFVNNRVSTGVYTAQVKRSTGSKSPGNEATLFEADADAQSLLSSWCQKQHLAKIAQVWVKGVHIDWKLLYGEALPYRVGLPTYPFTRERYWVPLGAVENVDQQPENHNMQEERLLFAESASPQTAPRNDLVQMIEEIWSNVLGISDIDIHCNFQELGGDSIMAARILTRLKQNFSFVLPLDKVFEIPTIAGMAQALEEELVAMAEELPEETLQQLLASRTLL